MIVKKQPLILDDSQLNKKMAVKDFLQLIDDNTLISKNDILHKLHEKLARRIPKKEKILPRKRTTFSVRHNQISPAINEFKKYYSQLGYADSTLEIHKRSLRQFLDFLILEYSEFGPFETVLDLSRLTKRMILAYEESLIFKLNTEQLQGCTVYRYLSSLKLLLSMLVHYKVTFIEYVIPEGLRIQGTRSNEYIETELIKRLVEAVANSNSVVRYRDMCVILLIMEIGCRPIEITNLTIDDLVLTERLIRVHSIKSGTRTLSISKDLSELLKEYLVHRKALTATNQSLFLNCFGETLTTNGVRAIFERSNKIAFNEHRFSPKALRHTYATNALDNENNFDEVSASMGHLHRCSTEWYIHRSVKRMLSRTLPHNPLNQMLGE